MTSGLASDSDKFKIIITLRRAQKFGDSLRTGPYKNFDFLFNRLLFNRLLNRLLRPGPQIDEISLTTNLGWIGYATLIDSYAKRDYSIV